MAEYGFQPRRQRELYPVHPRLQKKINSKAKRMEKRKTKNKEKVNSGVV
jgi:hypothetical protein